VLLVILLLYHLCVRICEVMDMLDLHSVMARTVVHAQSIGATPDDEGNAPCWLLLEGFEASLIAGTSSKRFYPILSLDCRVSFPIMRNWRSTLSRCVSVPELRRDRAVLSVSHTRTDRVLRVGVKFFVQR
jgi:hypothetical protein